MQKDELLHEINKYMDDNGIEVVYYSMLGNDKPTKGEVVLAFPFAGKSFCFDNQFGRVVQIRTGCGQFGSDMYFLRMPDGTLLTAENQAYRKIPEQFIEAVESHFSTNLDYENEGFENGFTISGKQLEVGFIVDGKSTQGTPDEAFGITITTQG